MSASVQNRDVQFWQIKAELENLPVWTSAPATFPMKKAFTRKLKLYIRDISLIYLLVKNTFSYGAIKLSRITSYINLKLDIVMKN